MNDENIGRDGCIVLAFVAVVCAVLWLLSGATWLPL